MIITAIINILYFIFNLLPDIDIEVLTVPELVTDLISFAWFILPMNTINTLLPLSITITIVRIGLAVIYRAKSFIPTMGN